MAGPESLVAVAERANASRSFLLVSRVLGKHIPLDAARCRLAGAALALAVAGDARAGEAANALHEGGRGQAHAYEAEPAALPGAVVIGFAETATALGEQVAATLDAAWFQTTTRQRTACRAPLAFEEVHSHAPGQWVDAPRAGWPDGPVVLVDDELTTGATAARLIELLHGVHPAPRYVVAALVDGRGRGEDALEQAGRRLRVPVEVIALERRGPTAPEPAGWSGGALAEAARPPAAAVREIELGFDGLLQHHGQDRAARRRFASAAGSAFERVGALPPGSLVVGTGEHLALAQRHALLAGALTSSTTRSPVLVSDRAGYPIREGVRFPNPDDVELPGYAYNLAVPERPAIVVHFQDRAHRLRGQHLIDVLAVSASGPLVAVTCVG